MISHYFITFHGLYDACFSTWRFFFTILMVLFLEIMISVSRILHLRRMYPVNSPPFSVTNRMLIPVCNQCVGDKNIVRQLEFKSVRNFGTYLKRWLRKAAMSEENEGEGLSDSRIQLIKMYDSINQDRATIGFVLNAINCLAGRHLLDEKSKLEKNVQDSMWDDRNACLRYWLAVFEGSKTPLAVKLEEKLKNEGICNKEFCSAMVAVYFTLKYENHFILTTFRIEPEDVLNVMNRLQFSNTQCDCLRILYSIHETYGWKISK